MATLEFREELEQASLKAKLRSLMAIRLVANLDDLALDSGLPANEARALLEAMVGAGEAERLRPLGYGKDDMDFFCLRCMPRPVRGAAWRRRRRHVWDRWIENAKCAVKAPIIRQRTNACA
jgi:hypothetical protein